MEPSFDRLFTLPEANQSLEKLRPIVADLIQARARLLEMERRKQEEEITEERRAQVGTGERSEKRERDEDKHRQGFLKRINDREICARTRCGDLAHEITGIASGRALDDHKHPERVFVEWPRERIAGCGNRRVEDERVRIARASARRPRAVRTRRAR